jgi:hypothetical protein
MSFLLYGEMVSGYGKKLINSDPFITSTDKHSIYPRTLYAAGGYGVTGSAPL